MSRIEWTTLLSLALLMLGGCNFGSDAGRPLGDERFTRAVNPTQSAVAPVDRGGPLLPNQLDVRFKRNQPEASGITETVDEGSAAEVSEVSPVVNQVTDGAANAVPEPSNAGESLQRVPVQPQDRADESSEKTAEMLTGQYFTVGGVVAEVNGHPIYANRVLNPLSRPLAAKAREVSREQFVTAARELIDRQVDELIRAEVLFAAADRNLTAEEKLLADSMTMNWRNNQITDAGGSLQQAVRNAAERGEDFEQLLQEQHRQFLTQVYVQKRLMPRVQLTAGDLRRYYESHINQFTQFDEATFRLIRIDPKKMDGRDAALDKVTTLWRQLQREEVDFATAAGQINHDSYLLKNNGLVPGPIQRGSYRESKVEEAVWNTAVGNVTDIITGSDGAFYVAKVESKRQGRVLAFEEEQVQDSIRNTLRAEQLRGLMDQARDKLAQNASVRRERDMVEVAVEMANQNYDRWRLSSVESTRP